VAGSAGAPVLRVDAARVANIQLVLWLEQGYGYDRWGAWQLLTQAGGLYVGNMVDKTYSLVASVVKARLGRAR
jgi:amidase